MLTGKETVSSSSRIKPNLQDKDRVLFSYYPKLAGPHPSTNLVHSLQQFGTVDFYMRYEVKFSTSFPVSAS